MGRWHPYDVALFDTRLDRFLAANRISPGDLSRTAGIPRQTLLKYRAGRADATVSAIRKCAVGATKVLGRIVHAVELFDINPSVNDVPRHGSRSAPL